MTEGNAVPSDREGAKAKQRRRARRWAIGLVGAYAFYAIALGVIAPRVAREPIEDAIGELLGVRLDIEWISVNPFTLRFEVADIELRDDAGDLLVSAKSLVVNLELLKSIVGVLRVSEMVLDTPEVYAAISPEGELNLLALLPEDEDEPEEENDDGDGMFPLRIDRFRLIDGRARMLDRSQEHLFIVSIAPIDLAIEHISTVPDEPGRVRLEATGSRGVHFVTEFDASIDPISARGELTLERLGHDMIGDYLGPNSIIRPTSGEIDVHADFAIEMAKESMLVLRIEKGDIEARSWKAESDLAELHHVGLERFAIQGLRLGLTEREVGIEQISIEGPRIAAVLPASGGDGTTVEAAAAASAPETAVAGEAPEPEEAPAVAPDDDSEWTIEVQRFAISDGHVSLAGPDARGEVVVEVGPIDFEGLGVSSEAGEDFEVTLRVALPDGVPADAASPRTSTDGPRVVAEGRIVPRPFLAELELRAIEVALAPWSPLVGFAPDVGISGGRVDVTSTVKASMPEGNDVADASIRADVNIRGLELQQGRGARGKSAPVVRAGRVLVEGIRVDDAGARIGVSKLRVDSPSIFIERDASGALNLARLMAPGPDDATSEDTAASPTIDVRRVEIADGRIDYRDATTSRAFSIDITDIEGSFERQRRASGEPDGHIDFAARIGTAPVTIKGEFPSAKRIDVDLMLEGLTVTSLAPYFEQYVGSEVEQGNLYLDLDYSLVERRVAGKNAVRFDRLVFGPRTGSKDALKLPVPLAFKLMTDTHGQAKFDLPIAGDLDDPDFSLRALITTAFVKVIQQSLSSPLAVLQTAMPDLTADKQTQITFAPGSSTLGAAQRETLVNVATLFASEPRHRIAIKGRVDGRRDAQALKEAGEEFDDERLRALGNERARSVRAELVDVLGLEADRIFLRSVDLGGKADEDVVAVDVVLTDD